MIIPSALWYAGLAAYAAASCHLLHTQIYTGIAAWQGLAWLAACYGVAIVGQHRTIHPDEPPVVWSWLPFLGSAISFGTDTLAFIRGCRAAYGDAFTLIIAGKRMTFITDPLAQSGFLRKTKELAFQPVANDVQAKAFNASASIMAHMEELTSKESHRFYVTHLQNPAALAKLTWCAAASLESALRVDAVVGGASGLVGGWARVPFYATVARALFVASVETFFGPKFATEQNFQDFKAFDKDFPLMVAGVPMQGGRRALAKLMAQFGPSSIPGEGYESEASDFIKARAAMFRAAESEHGMAHVAHSGGQAAILWATVANTMPAAFWTLYFLARDPNGAAAVRAELARVQGGAAGGGGGGGEEAAAALGPTELDSLVVLDSCITEALRLTSGSIVMREAATNSSGFVELDLPSTAAGSSATGAKPRTVRLRGGDRVAVYPPLVHLDSRAFPEADAFKHDRFLGEGGAKLAKTVMPFGGGVSKCPGRMFATREIKSFVALAFARFEWSLIPPGTGAEGENKKGEMPVPREPPVGSPMPPVPAFDDSRSGLGIFPPKKDLEVFVRPRN